jgi:hypothetical protein
MNKTKHLAMFEGSGALDAYNRQGDDVDTTDDSDIKPYQTYPPFGVDETEDDELGKPIVCASSRASPDACLICLAVVIVCY